jgi:unsaturated rhamnogalacturonyl hydrolase
MRKNYIIACVLCLLALFACNGKHKVESAQGKKWSVIMADAVIHNCDSLINYMDNPRWQYDVALLGRAIARISLYEDTNGYFNYMKDYIDYFVEDDGTVRYYKIEEYNLDRIQPARNLIWLYEKTGKEKYKLAISLFIEQLKSQPRTSEGGFWHKKVYPYQMWLDGIYMASPFMAEYAKKFDDPEWYDVACKQITLIYQKTLDTNTGLLYHAWDESRSQRWCNPETGQSKHFWGRAMGWYMMAMVDVLDFLPLDHPDRGKIIEILKNVSGALLKVQDDKTGLWYQVLDKGGMKGNYLEASGTAMFAYAFAKGAKNGYLDEKYLEIAKKVHKSIVENLIVYNKDGQPVLTNVCGGCGLGGDPYRDGSYEYYVTEQVVDNDSKGVAPFILLSIELENL